jgi:hypothetical protein
MTSAIMCGHHKKELHEIKIIKHHPVVCQHLYISSMCTTSKNGSCKLDVFTTMLMKIQVFGDGMPCWLVSSYQCSVWTTILQNVGDSSPMNTVQHLRRLVPSSFNALAICHIQQITYSSVNVSLCPAYTDAHLILSLLLKLPVHKRKANTISIGNHR